MAQHERDSFSKDFIPFLNIHTSHLRYSCITKCGAIENQTRTLLTKPIARVLHSYITIIKSQVSNPIGLTWTPSKLKLHTFPHSRLTHALMQCHYFIILNLWMMQFIILNMCLLTYNCNLKFSIKTNFYSHKIIMFMPNL